MNVNSDKFEHQAAEMRSYCTPQSYGINSPPPRQPTGQLSQPVPVPKVEDDEFQFTYSPRALKFMNGEEQVANSHYMVIARAETAEILE